MPDTEWEEKKKRYESAGKEKSFDELPEEWRGMAMDRYEELKRTAPELGDDELKRLAIQEAGTGTLAYRAHEAGEAGEGPEEDEVLSIRRAQIKKMRPTFEKYELMKEMNLEVADKTREERVAGLEADASEAFEAGDYDTAGAKFMEAYKITGKGRLALKAADAFAISDDRTMEFKAIEEYLKHAPDDEVPYLYERLRVIQRPAEDQT